MGLRAPERVVNSATGWGEESSSRDLTTACGGEKHRGTPTSSQHLGLLLDLVGPTQGRLGTE